MMPSSSPKNFTSLVSLHILDASEYVKKIHLHTCLTKLAISFSRWLALRLKDYLLCCDSDYYHRVK